LGDKDSVSKPPTFEVSKTTLFATQYLKDEVEARTLG
jgi:hypothetical protein